MKKHTLLFLLLFLASEISMAQFVFNRVIEKQPTSDTIILHYQIRKFQPGEICRIQQKIPSSFALLYQEKKSDTLYFNQDVVTSIWTSLPSDSIIDFKIIIKAPEKTQGYLYIGDCACMYGGKLANPIRKYIAKERVFMLDTTLIPKQDTLLFSQIDSINKKNLLNQKGKNRRVQKTKEEYYFRIQITASKFKQELKDVSKEAIAPDKVYEEQLDSWYKYTIGNFKTYKIAQERLKLYQQHNTKGYKKKKKNGVRIGIQEANKELQTTDEE
jgi:hypothetical protein